MTYTSSIKTGSLYTSCIKFNFLMIPAPVIKPKGLVDICLCMDNNICGYIYNIRTLSVNIKFICTSFRNRQNSEPLASFSDLFRSEYKWILYLTTMYVYCVYPAMSNESENLSDLDKKDRNKCHSSPFINVVKGVFFMVRVTLVPVSYLSAPSAVHSYRVPGKFIRRLKSLFV